MKFHIARILIGTPLLASIVLLSPASAQTPATYTHRMSVCPSKLDYLVLASFADSSNMLAMSTYRTPKMAGVAVDSTPVAVEEKSLSAD